MPVYFVIVLLALLIEAAALAFLFWKHGGLSRRVDMISKEAWRESAGGEDDLSPAEARRMALEAERRFTEGVTNILNFSCGSSGKKGE